MAIPGSAQPDNGLDEDAKVRGYERALRRFFSGRVRSRDDVNDLVQETFARMFASNRQQNVDNPIAYLFRIASNLLADRARLQSRRPPCVELDDRRPELAIVPDQEHARDLADLKKLLEMALAQLPSKCGDAFVMRRFRGMTTPEIAAALQISERMVQKHLVRALAHIHELVAGTGKDMSCGW